MRQISLRSLLILFNLFILSNEVFGQEIELDSSVVEQVEDGEIFVTTWKAYGNLHISAVFLINQPIDFVWNYLINAEKYLEIYDEYEEIIVFPVTENVEDVSYSIKTPVGLKKYILRREYDPVHTNFQWNLVSGDFHIVSGHYTLSKKNDFTILQYYSILHIGIPIADAFSNVGAAKRTRQSIEELINWFEQ